MLVSEVRGRQHSPALPPLLSVSRLMIWPVVLTAMLGRGEYTGRPEGDETGKAAETCD